MDADETPARIEIDPNVRLPRGRTFVGRSDAPTVKVGDDVVAFESEEGVEWDATVCEIDDEKDLVYLVVRWHSGRRYAADETQEEPHHSDPGEPCTHPFCVAKRALDEVRPSEATGFTRAEVEAIRNRAATALEWSRRCMPDGWLPLSVRDHYKRDMPALLAKLAEAEADLADLRRRFQALDLDWSRLASARDEALGQSARHAADRDKALDELAIANRKCDEARANADRLREVRRLALKPGDTLVLEFPDHITDREHARLRDVFRDAFPDHRTMVVERASLVVVEAVAPEEAGTASDGLSVPGRTERPIGPAGPSGAATEGARGNVDGGESE